MENKPANSLVESLGKALKATLSSYLGSDSWQLALKIEKVPLPSPCQSNSTLTNR